MGKYERQSAHRTKPSCALRDYRPCHVLSTAGRNVGSSLLLLPRGRLFRLRGPAQWLLPSDARATGVITAGPTYCPGRRSLADPSVMIRHVMFARHTPRLFRLHAPRLVTACLVWSGVSLRFDTTRAELTVVQVMPLRDCARRSWLLLHITELKASDKTKQEHRQLKT